MRLMLLNGPMKRFSRLYSSWIRVSEEVKDAVQSGSPVVALETAILTHGLPSPLNLELSKTVESIIRSRGVVPATVGLLNGQMCVGLSNSELEALANAYSPWKVSRRDIPRLIASRDSFGGTTVSGTMVGAHAAGIPIFATGGIGGVHRGADSTWDISADLIELGRTPVCVVCAGAKSILDLSRTLEVLETQGVSVVSLKSDFFPAFYLPSSGLRSPARVDDVAEAARVVNAMIRSKVGSGIVLAVPIPDSEAGKEIETSMEIAIREADKAGITGRDVTPFLLDRIASLSSGESIRANVALVKNNALIAAQVAVELSELEKHSENNTHQFFSKNEVQSKSESCDREVLIVGGSNIDFVCTVDSATNLDDVRTAASYPGRVQQSCGGVGRNIAETVARLGSPHRLLTALGNDDSSDFIRKSCEFLNLNRALVVEDGSTAQYTAILNSNGELMFGVGDMNIHQKIDSHYLQQNADLIPNAHVVLVDGNLSMATLRSAADICHQNNVPLWFEPTDVLKASRILDALETEQKVDFASPNIAEFESIYRRLVGVEINMQDKLSTSLTSQSLRSVLHELALACESLESKISRLLIKLGPKGVFFWDSRGRTDRTGFWCSSVAVRDDSIASVSGCGDSLVGAFIVGRWLHQWPVEMCVQAGIKAAHLSLLIQCAVSPSVNPCNFSSEEITLWGRKLEQTWL